MILNFIRSRFCSLKKFRAVQSVMSTIYHHNDHTKEMLLQRFKLIGQKKAQDQNYEIEPRLVLSDRIKSVLKRMEEQKKITQQIKVELLDFINPLKGVNISQLQDQPRFSQGKKQYSQLFPLHPNSVVAKFMMYQLYGLDTDERFIKNTNTQALQSLYIVGTPGIGKSSTLYMTKLIHDMRISHVIKQGCPHDSLFKKNIKIFYLYSLASRIQIMTKMIKEVETDFGELPNKFLNFRIQQRKFEYFIQKIAQIYREKQIQVFLIVDQMNALYNRKKGSGIKKLIKNWKIIKDNFTKPIIMVSSKNNEQLVSQDPILQINNAGQQDLRKISLDDYMSTQARLCYVAQCLLFQLEKNNIPRDDALNIVNNINELPLVSHLAIRKAVDQSLYQFPIIQKKIQTEKIIRTLKNKLQENQDIKKMKNNLLQFKIQNEKVIKSSKKAQIQQQEQSLDILLSLYNIVLKTPSIRRINVKMIIQNEKNQQIQLERSFNSYCRKINDQDQSQKTNFLKYLKNLSNKNFFYIDYLLAKWTGYQAIPYLYFTLSSKDFEELRRQAINFISPEVLALYSKKYGPLINDFIQRTQGEIFQSLVASRLELSKTKQIKLIIEFTHRYSSNSAKILFHLGQKLNFIVKKNQNFQPFHETKKQYIDYILQQNSSSYCRSIEGGLTFDFIISIFEDHKLKLFFIDTTISQNIFQKNSNFYRFLLSNQKFKFLIQQLNKKIQLKALQVQIYFYVLRPNFLFEQNNLKKSSLQQYKQIEQKHQQKQQKKDCLKQQAIEYVKKMSQKISIIDNDEGILGEQFHIKSKGVPQSIDQCREINKQFRAIRQLKQNKRRRSQKN